MKVNPILLVIGLLMAALLSYMFYAMASESDEYLTLLVISGFIGTAVTLSGILAFSVENTGKSTNLRVVSGLFFLLFLIEHCVMAWMGVSLSAHIVICGLLLLFYMLFFYSINKTKM